MASGARVLLRGTLIPRGARSPGSRSFFGSHEFWPRFSRIEGNRVSDSKISVQREMPRLLRPRDCHSSGGNRGNGRKLGKAGKVGKPLSGTRTASYGRAAAQRLGVGPGDPGQFGSGRFTRIAQTPYISMLYTTPIQLIQEIQVKGKSSEESVWENHPPEKRGRREAYLKDYPKKGGSLGTLGSPNQKQWVTNSRTLITARNTRITPKPTRKPRSGQSTTTANEEHRSPGCASYQGHGFRVIVHPGVSITPLHRGPKPTLELRTALS